MVDKGQEPGHGLSLYTKAKTPIDPKLLGFIPYFATIFPDRNFWSTIVRLSGDDGIAHVEHKGFEAGQKLIAKGQFDQRIYWILGGSAQVVSEIKGQAKVIHEARKGECIGELGVLRAAIRTADVIAGKKGVDVLGLDWAITEKSPALGKYFYHLIALNLADKLDNSYDKQLKIIANSIIILHEKTSQLIDRNRYLEKVLEDHTIAFKPENAVSQEEAVSHAIASIKESLSFLETEENRHNLEKLGVV